MTDELRDKLRVCDEDAYGSDYKAHSLEIYKVYLQMADNISARRQAANTFFLTVNTGLVGIIGYFSNEPTLRTIPVILAGVVLCFVWYRLIISYKGLNSGKFKVVHELEKVLPLSPYDAEWEVLGRGKDPKHYRPFTDIEAGVPWVFAVLYVALTLAVFTGY